MNLVIFPASSCPSSWFKHSKSIVVFHCSAYLPTCTTLGLTRACNHAKWVSWVDTVSPSGVESVSRSGVESVSPSGVESVSPSGVESVSPRMRINCAYVPLLPNPLRAELHIATSPWNKHQTPCKPCTKQDMWKQTCYFFTENCWITPQGHFVPQLYHKTVQSTSSLKTSSFTCA